MKNVHAALLLVLSLPSVALADGPPDGLLARRAADWSAGGRPAPLRPQGRIDWTPDEDILWDMLPSWDGKAPFWGDVSRRTLMLSWAPTARWAGFRTAPAAAGMYDLSFDGLLAGDILALGEDLQFAGTHGDYRLTRNTAYAGLNMPLAHRGRTWHVLAAYRLHRFPQDSFPGQSGFHGTDVQKELYLRLALGHMEAEHARSLHAGDKGGSSTRVTAYLPLVAEFPAWARTLLPEVESDRLGVALLARLHYNHRYFRRASSFTHIDFTLEPLPLPGLEEYANERWEFQGPYLYVGYQLGLARGFDDAWLWGIEFRLSRRDRWESPID